jgi:phage gpG-like protein
MIDAKVNADDALGAFKRLARSIENREPINRRVAVQFQSWVFRNFDQSGGLRDVPWVPLSPRTQRQKARLGFSPKPLFRTGNLRNSFLGFSDNDTMGVGARASFGVDYAEVHEFGAPDRNIPARPMLPPQGEALQLASRIYTLSLGEAAQKAGLSS